MKKTTILKSLIVAAGMLVGTSAWAEENVISLTSVESAWYDNSEMHIGAGEDGFIYANNTQFRDWNSGADGSVKFNTNGKIAFYKFNISDFLTAEGVLKDVTFTFTSRSSESAKSCDKIRALGYNGDYNDFKNNGSKETLTGTVDGAGSFQPLDDKTEFSIKAETATNVNAMTYVKSAIEAGNTFVTFAITINHGRTLHLNPTASLVATFSTASQAGYTVTYVDEDGKSIKDADESRTETVGFNVTLTEEDKSVITVGDDHYLYVSDNTSDVTVAEDGSTVIVVKFRKAETFTYSVKSSFGTVLQEGTGYETETINYYWAAVLNNEGTLYTAQAVNSGYKGSFILNENNKEVTVNYTAGDITSLVFLSEGEDVFTKGTGNTADTRASMGAGGYQNSAKDFVTLSAGKYVLVVSNRCTGDRTAIHNFTAGTGDDAVTILAADGHGYNFTVTSDEFELTKSTTLYFQGGSDNQWVDYLYIYKTADYNETKTISAAGYATYCSENALDFTNVEGLTAYVAKVTGSDVTFEAVTKVPAQTGVLLKGAEGEYQIPVVADGGEATSALVGVLEDTQVAAGSFVLMNGAQGVGFYKTASEFTVGANTAYLPAQTTGTARSFIGFDGESSTGSSAVENAVLSTEVYDLQGRRVAQPTKGLYIMNGKKTVLR